MANASKGIRSDSQLEKTARRRDDAAVRCQSEAKAIRVKMARRRAFRLADAAATTATVITIMKPFKPVDKKSSSLSDWQEQQQKDGRSV